MASAQLQLIHTDHTWKLDQHTVKVGRAGIAQARAALAAATEDSEDEGRLFSYTVERADDRTQVATPARTRRDPAPGDTDGHRAAA